MEKGTLSAFTKIDDRLGESVESFVNMGFI